ncbi:MAG TPA: hypothetical protein VF981_09145 [Gemmatimonadaceae bacterium]
MVSARAALVIALTALILLGVLALWLVNVPLWAAAGAGVLAGLVAGLIARRANRRDRQKTEA